MYHIQRFGYQIYELTWTAFGIHKYIQLINDEYKLDFIDCLIYVALSLFIFILQDKLF